MGGVLRRPGGEKNTNLNVDRKNPGGYSSRDLEQMRMASENDGGYSSKDLERMDKKNPGGNPKPSTTPKPKPKSVEQPKVAAQMDNTEVKSDLITADKTAPTSIEMENENLLKRKRGRKTKTVLTSITGDTSNPTLSKKALLG